MDTHTLKRIIPIALCLVACQADDDVEGSSGIAASGSGGSVDTEGGVAATDGATDVGGGAEAGGPGSGTCDEEHPLFAHSLCVCDDLLDAGALRVRRGSGGSGSVGVNGFTQLAGDIRIDGSAIFYGGIVAPLNLEVGGSMATAASADIVGRASVAGDLDVGEDLLGIGYLDLAGRLRVDGRRLILGYSPNAGIGEYVAPEVPCGCGEAEILDVPALVDEAREDNDNDVVGLPTQFAQIGFSEVTLPEGRYYVGDVRSLGALRVRIEGHVELYLDGSLDLVGYSNFELAEDAVLDLYVSGNVSSVGRVKFGNEAAPGNFRLYVGGEDPIGVSAGDQDFYGAIYAPRATLHYVGATRVVGALFVETLRGAGLLEVESSIIGVPSDDDCDDSDGGDETEDGGNPGSGGSATTGGEGGETEGGRDTDLPVP